MLTILGWIVVANVVFWVLVGLGAIFLRASQPLVDRYFELKWRFTGPPKVKAIPEEASPTFR